MIKCYPYFLILLALGFSCTDNPFFGGQDGALDKHLVRGKVMLSDGKSPENIYVWLDSLNISTRTGANGDFSLNLPKGDSLTGYNSTMQLYYYVANYKITFSTVLVHDGLFEYNKYDINNEGRIKSTVVLSKLLDISTDISPSTLSPSSEPRLLNINVTLRTIDTTVMVFTEMDRELVLGSYIFKESGTAQDQAIRISNQGVSIKGFFIDSSSIWQGQLLWQPGMLTSGIYEVYPYLIIQQEDFPDGLLESFGSNATKFSENYLKIPFRHDTAVLTVN